MESCDSEGDGSENVDSELSIMEYGDGEAGNPKNLDDEMGDANLAIPEELLNERRWWCGVLVLVVEE
ncbi:hypothetical protein PR202_ga11225 [Eleusine coracana subsp. coracana]|uniref:Uncharacterized protein n=1 Tax=Eleusine coracana subsp. coracana TaxID=191504 RepID=A0AAV5C8R2_ELECO|nr:hypothetical protein PR202_ga11225 [Eleusine coracana subsp. coracana]